MSKEDYKRVKLSKDDARKIVNGEVKPFGVQYNPETGDLTGLVRNGGGKPSWERAFEENTDSSDWPPTLRVKHGLPPKP